MALDPQTVADIVEIEQLAATSSDRIVPLRRVGRTSSGAGVLELGGAERGAVTFAAAVGRLTSRATDELLVGWCVR
jgi:hypothetical protein